MDERSIFLTALEKDDPVERSAYLDEICARDPKLRQQVEALLEAHAAPGSFLDRPFLDLRATTDDASADSPISASPTHRESTPLHFLGFTDKPGCLGMLGEYEVLEAVGSGGMGIVFRALDPRLNRIVAVKVLAPELAVQTIAVQRFLREARAAAAVSHPNVVSIFHVEDKQRPPFLVMEFIAGRSLQQKIDEKGALGVKEILRIGMQAARGIAAAHAQGLVHRDVKPANILLENGVERVKITDFGLARAVDDVGMTRTGTILGTPQYMSPEQANSQALDGRSDLFSLGCVLYAMATGRPPFRGNTTVEVILQVCEDEPTPIRDVNPDIPDWLAEIIDKLMAKSRADRFPAATEVADLLEGHLAHLQQPDAVPMPARVGAVRPRYRSRRSSSNWVLWVVVILAAVMCLAALPVVLIFGLTTLLLRPAEFGSELSAHPPVVEIRGEGPPLPPENPAVVGIQERSDLLDRLKNMPRLVSVKSFHLPIRIRPDQQFRFGRIAPGGRYLALQANNVSVFDLHTKKELHDFFAIQGSMAFSPDGKTLAYGGLTADTGGEMALVFLDLETGKRQYSQPLSPAPFHGRDLCVAFAGDGKTLVLGGGYVSDPGQAHFGRVALLDRSSHRLFKTLDLPRGKVNSVAMGRDGNKILAVGGNDDAPGSAINALLLDQTGTGNQRQLAPQEAQSGRWTAAVVAPRGTRAAAVWGQSDDRQQLFIWDLKAGATWEFGGLGTLPLQSGLVLSPDGKQLVVPVLPKNFPGPVGMVINLDKVRPEAVLWHGEQGGNFPCAIGFAEDGHSILTVDSDGTVHQWGKAAQDE